MRPCRVGAGHGDRRGGGQRLISHSLSPASAPPPPASEAEAQAPGEGVDTPAQHWEAQEVPSLPPRAERLLTGTTITHAPVLLVCARVHTHGPM